MITLTAKITLADGTIYDIDRKNILSIDASLIDRSDISLPSWGIISNKGNLSFVDYKGDIKRLVESLMLSENAKVTIFLTNTITKSTKELKNYLTSKWDYDSNSRTVTVNLKDDLEEWQDIQIKGFDYDVSYPQKVLPNQTMADLYRWLYGKTPVKYLMKSFKELDDDTQDVLNSTTIPYPILKKGTLWAQWTKLCVACGLYIYKDSQGNTTCSYNYGA